MFGSKVWVLWQRHRNKGIGTEQTTLFADTESESKAKSYAKLLSLLYVRKSKY